ncbi:hypothetical protein DPMN_092728 [Dreissena polymorpha]|uniref:Uncharacterized protein n=1 Tax=Dreissena polymorpha TaxID=45954 RepID=A0A9D4R0F8_DREPO|nr:hypothetical protein DPMN_092728 [Dreissena polymorpha]
MLTPCYMWFCFAGHFYHEQRRACNALEYLDQTYEIFTALSTPRPVSRNSMEHWETV